MECQWLVQGDVRIGDFVLVGNAIGTAKMVN
jgi:hypothetical protein